MTREEAFETASEFYGDKQNSYSMINIIYDEFESRTCENCKHSALTFSKEYYDCWVNVGNYLTEHGELLCSKDFGCNKWESK